MPAHTNTSRTLVSTKSVIIIPHSSFGAKPEQSMHRQQKLNARTFSRKSQGHGVSAAAGSIRANTPAGIDYGIWICRILVLTQQPEQEPRTTTQPKLQHDLIVVVMPLVPSRMLTLTAPAGVRASESFFSQKRRLRPKTRGSRDLRERANDSLNAE